MFYTYVLCCINQLKPNKLYIGSTEDLRKECLITMPNLPRQLKDLTGLS